MKFGIDRDGNYGYIKAGADTVTPFKSGQVWFGRFTSNVSEVNCGFQPDIIVRVMDMARNYPSMSCIDYINEKAIMFFLNKSNGNSGFNTDDNGYGFSYLSPGITRTSNGFTTKEQMTANSSNPVYIWCIKVS